MSLRTCRYHLPTTLRGSTTDHRFLAAAEEARLRFDVTRGQVTLPATVSRSQSCWLVEHAGWTQ